MIDKLFMHEELIYSCAREDRGPLLSISPPGIRKKLAKKLDLLNTALDGCRVRCCIVTLADLFRFPVWSRRSFGHALSDDLSFAQANQCPVPLIVICIF